MFCARIFVLDDESKNTHTPTVWTSILHHRIDFVNAYFSFLLPFFCNNRNRQAFSKACRLYFYSFYSSE